MTGPVAAVTGDGGRMHLQHGPIDLIIEVSGSDAARDRAHERAARRFASILDELVAELTILRRPLGSRRPASPVGRRMAVAIEPFDDVFVTPMAAVAGAVADEVLAAAVGTDSRDGVERIFVNNGGDIALHLGQRGRFDIGLVPDPRIPHVVGKMVVRACDPVRGIATSGRHGRSLSLGIADAVTVLARDAATADVAATLIANAVDLPCHPSIERVPASEIDTGSDLDDLPVTVDVGHLSEHDVDTALASGSETAKRFLDRGHIVAAVLALGGQIERVGNPTGPDRVATLGSVSQRSPIS